MIQQNLPAFKQAWGIGGNQPSIQAPSQSMSAQNPTPAPPVIKPPDIAQPVPTGAGIMPTQNRPVAAPVEKQFDPQSIIAQGRGMGGTYDKTIQVRNPEYGKTTETGGGEEVLLTDNEGNPIEGAKAGTASGILKTDTREFIDQNVKGTSDLLRLHETPKTPAAGIGGVDTAINMIKNDKSSYYGGIKSNGMTDKSKALIADLESKGRAEALHQKNYGIYVNEISKYNAMEKQSRDKDVSNRKKVEDFTKNMNLYGKNMMGQVNPVLGALHIMGSGNIKSTDLPDDPIIRSAFQQAQDIFEDTWIKTQQATEKKTGKPFLRNKQNESLVLKDITDHYNKVSIQ
jgi:hypothetical protein